MSGKLQNGIIARLLLAAAIATAGIALAQAQSAPHAKPAKPPAEHKTAAKPAVDLSLPKTVQIGEPAPQVKPPRPIAPQTPPPARSGRGAFAQQSGPVAVLPVPQMTTAASATIRPEMKSPTPLPAAKPAASKPAAKPLAAKQDRRAALTSQKQTGGR